VCLQPQTLRFCSELITLKKVNLSAVTQTYTTFPASYDPIFFLKKMPLSITPRLSARKTNCSISAKMTWWLYSASDPYEPLMKWEMLCILLKTFLARSQWKATKLSLCSTSSLRPRRHFYEIWHWKVSLKFIIKLALVTSHNYEHLHEKQMLLRACEIYFQQTWRRKIKHKFYAQLISSVTLQFSG